MVMLRKAINQQAIFILLIILTSNLQAAILEGLVVTQDQRPIAGAMVTVFEEGSDISETVYSDYQGGFMLPTKISGKIRLRARTPYFADQILNLNIKSHQKKTIKFTIEKLKSPEALSNNQPASAHAKHLKFNDPKVRTNFRSQCHYCHQIGNAWTRRLRSEDEWNGVISRMQTYAAVIEDTTRDALIKTLARDFNGKPIAAVETYDVSPELFNAKYVEWPVKNGDTFVHDVESYSGDGKLYSVDMHNDRLIVIDPKTNETEVINLPESESPLGGMFSGHVAFVGNYLAKNGPHSLEEGPNGKLWMSNALSGEIVSFDPRTKAFETFPVGGDALYPHTLRWDKKGILWFTIALSNQMGRFDPKTEIFTLIDLPTHSFDSWMSDAMLPSLLWLASFYPKTDMLNKMMGTNMHHSSVAMPYGIDINPVDGSIWYAALQSNYIGRIDPDTLEITDFDTPKKGPRRIRFDKEGMLWIPAFTESALLKFNPNTEEFKIFEMPTLADGEYEIPYAVGIHPETQDVWVTSNLSDRVFRFYPKTEKWISYPSPTRVNYTRNFSFAEDGGVCSSNSNVPAHSIEGGYQKILCIYPNALVKESQAIKSIVQTQK